MKCIQCNKEIEDGQTMIPMTPDGDFTCGLICKVTYENKRDDFLSQTIHDDKLMKEWWRDTPWEQK